MYTIFWFSGNVDHGFKLSYYSVQSNNDQNIERSRDIKIQYFKLTFFFFFGRNTRLFNFTTQT